MTSEPNKDENSISGEQSDATRRRNLMVGRLVTLAAVTLLVAIIAIAWTYQRKTANARAALEGLRENWSGKLFSARVHDALNSGRNPMEPSEADNVTAQIMREEARLQEELQIQSHKARFLAARAGVLFASAVLGFQLLLVLGLDRMRRGRHFSSGESAVVTSSKRRSWPIILGAFLLVTGVIGIVFTSVGDGGVRATGCTSISVHGYETNVPGGVDTFEMTVVSPGPERIYRIRLSYGVSGCIESVEATEVAK